MYFFLLGTICLLGILYLLDVLYLLGILYLLDGLLDVLYLLDGLLDVLYLLQLLLMTSSVYFICSVYSVTCLVYFTWRVTRDSCSALAFVRLKNVKKKPCSAGRLFLGRAVHGGGGGGGGGRRGSCPARKLFFFPNIVFEFTEVFLVGCSNITRK